MAISVSGTNFLKEKTKRKKIVQCNESNDKDVSWNIVCIEVQTQ